MAIYHRLFAVVAASAYILNMYGAASSSSSSSSSTSSKTGSEVRDLACLVKTFNEGMAHLERPEHLVKPQACCWKKFKSVAQVLYDLDTKCSDGMAHSCGPRSGRKDPSSVVDYGSSDVRRLALLLTHGGLVSGDFDEKKMFLPNVSEKKEETTVSDLRQVCSTNIKRRLQRHGWGILMGHRNAGSSSIEDRGGWQRSGYEKEACFSQSGLVYDGFERCKIYEDLCSNVRGQFNKSFFQEMVFPSDPYQGKLNGVDALEGARKTKALKTINKNLDALCACIEKVIAYMKSFNLLIPFDPHMDWHFFSQTTTQHWEWLINKLGDHIDVFFNKNATSDLEACQGSVAKFYFCMQEVLYCSYSSEDVLPHLYDLVLKFEAMCEKREDSIAILKKLCPRWVEKYKKIEPSNLLSKQDTIVSARCELCRGITACDENLKREDFLGTKAHMEQVHQLAEYFMQLIYENEVDTQEMKNESQFFQFMFPESAVFRSFCYQIKPSNGFVFKLVQDFEEIIQAEYDFDCALAGLVGALNTQGKKTVALLQPFTEKIKASLQHLMKVSPLSVDPLCASETILNLLKAVDWMRETEKDLLECIHSAFSCCYASEDCNPHLYVLKCHIQALQRLKRAKAPQTVWGIVEATIAAKSVGMTSLFQRHAPLFETAQKVEVYGPAFSEITNFIKSGDDLESHRWSVADRLRQLKKRQPDEGALRSVAHVAHHLFLNKDVLCQADERYGMSLYYEWVDMCCAYIETAFCQFKGSRPLFNRYQYFKTDAPLRRLCQALVDEGAKNQSLKDYHVRLLLCVQSIMPEGSLKRRVDAHLKHTIERLKQGCKDLWGGLNWENITDLNYRLQSRPIEIENVVTNMLCAACMYHDIKKHDSTFEIVKDGGWGKKEEVGSYKNRLLYCIRYGLPDQLHNRCYAFVEKAAQILCDEPCGGFSISYEYFSDLDGFDDFRTMFERAKIIHYEHAIAQCDSFEYWLNDNNENHRRIGVGSLERMASVLPDGHPMKRRIQDRIATVESCERESDTGAASSSHSTTSSSVPLPLTNDHSETSKNIQNPMQLPSNADNPAQGERWLDVLSNKQVGVILVASVLIGGCILLRKKLPSKKAAVEKLKKLFRRQVSQVPVSA